MYEIQYIDSLMVNWNNYTNPFISVRTEEWVGKMYKMANAKTKDQDLTCILVVPDKTLVSVKEFHMSSAMQK